MFCTSGSYTQVYTTERVLTESYHTSHFPFGDTKLFFLWGLWCQFTEKCTFTSQLCYLLTSIKWTTKMEFLRLWRHSTVDSFVEACPVSIILRIRRGLCMWFLFTPLVQTNTTLFAHFSNCVIKSMFTAFFFCLVWWVMCV